MSDHRPNEPSPRDFKESPARSPEPPADLEPTEPSSAADDSAAHPS